MERNVVEQIYPLAKDVFEQKASKNEAQDILARDAGMHPGSAGMYIQAFLNMMDGECYKRAINGCATKHFLEMIRKDFGEQALKKALSSVKQHVEYYEGFGGKLNKIRGIYQEFSDIPIPETESKRREPPQKKRKYNPVGRTSDRVMRDSYERFFSEGFITKEQFFDFGVRETIYAPFNTAQAGWEELKQRIKENQPVYMRGFGGNASKSHMYQEFYKHVLGNENVLIDPTGNNEPGVVIRDMTGYSKNARTDHGLISNYQISHIFGRTKNIYMFAAPWNIVYLPKIIDPLTGHEAKGDFADEYKVIFQKKSYDRFKILIEDYNALISDEVFKRRVDGYLEDISQNNHYPQSDIDQLVKSVHRELAPIVISEE